MEGEEVHLELLVLQFSLSGCTVSVCHINYIPSHMYPQVETQLHMIIRGIRSTITRIPTLTQVFQT